MKLQKNNFVLYTDNNGEVKVEVFLQDETLWLTQKAMAKLFGVKVPAISKHLKNIFESGELDEKVVVSILEITTFGSNSPDSNIFFKCFEIAGTFTSNSSLICF
jgi:hypothetical protein